MLVVCAHCGSSLVERRNRTTGLPFLACERDPACPGTRASVDGNGLPRRPRVRAQEHGSSRGRWWRAARRAIWALAD